MAKTPKRIRISVTADDIRNGQRFTSNRCPVALAMARRFDATNSVSVRLTCAYVGGNKWRLSHRAYDFIVAFDSGKNVRPFTTTLEAQQ